MVCQIPLVGLFVQQFVSANNKTIISLRFIGPFCDALPSQMTSDAHTLPCNGIIMTTFKLITLKFTFDPPVHRRKSLLVYGIDSD